MTLAAWLGQLIGEAIKPILKEVIREAFAERAVVAKPNDELQKLAAESADPDDPYGLFRSPKSNHREGGDGRSPG